MSPNKSNKTTVDNSVATLRKEARNAKTREEIETVLQKIYARKGELWAELEKLTKLHTKLEEDRSKIDCETLFPTEADITPERVMSLNWETVTGKLYKTVDRWFGKFQYVRNSGYVPATLQPSIQVWLQKSKPVEPQIAEAMLFVPHLKKFTPERADGLENVRFLDIMEYTLSAGGSYSIYILEDDRALLTIMRYHRFSIIKEFDNLDQCLRYVHEHHPYERTSEEEAEDDTEW